MTDTTFTTFEEGQTKLRELGVYDPVEVAVKAASRAEAERLVEALSAHESADADAYVFVTGSDVHDCSSGIDVTLSVTFALGGGIAMADSVVMVEGVESARAYVVEDLRRYVAETLIELGSPWSLTV